MRISMQLVELSAITPSTTNPRKTFDKAAQDELTESVGRHGVLMPILLRLNGGPDSYEIVAGERRFRAAKAAGLKEIPATVRELSDSEVVELQVVENLHRADLLPLEEADGYAALMKCTHTDGHAYSVDEIAAKVGKSKGYVYARLKLGELCEEGRKALAAGEISTAVAELVARVPGLAQQEDALNQVSDKWGSPMSLREARDHIHRNFMLRLDQAAFDTKAIYLIEGREIQACKDCPRRTGNEPDLFPDVKAKDTCTDPACFGAKTKAAIMLKVEEHREAGKTVIAGAAAKKIIPKEWSEPKGYVKLDARCDDDEKGRHWRAVLGKACPPVVLVENPHKVGEFLELVPEKEARAALAKKHPEIAKRIAQEAREHGKGHRDFEVEKQTRFRVHLALREVIGRDGFTNAELIEIGLSQIDYHSGIDSEMAPHWGLPKEHECEEAEAKLRATTGSELLQMIFDLLLPPAYQNHVKAHDHLAKLHGIDVKAIERQVKAELKEKAKAKPDVQEKEEGVDA